MSDFTGSGAVSVQSGAVVAQSGPDLSAKHYVIVAQVDGADIVCRVLGADGFGPLNRIIGRSQYITGNPYAVYGDAVRAYCGRNATDCRLTVAIVDSGSLI